MRQPRLRDFAAGALLANGPMWIMSLFMPTLAEASLARTILLVLPISVVCGAVSGYMIARRTETNKVRAGLTTGFFSYALYAGSLLIVGARSSMALDASALTGLVLGGAIGTRLNELKKL
jgi:ABC-type glucose/galactose transport system permease subunit